MPLLKSDELNFYEYVDKVVRMYSARIIRMFNTLRSKKFDKNRDLIAYLDDFYDDLYILALEAYRSIAKRYYGEDLGTKWIEDKILKTYDPVTLYVFTHEVDRKRGRHLEAVIASDNPAAEHDKAMKYWVNMFRQYADEVADRANIEKLKKSGEKEVIWMTEKDNRVCRTCRDREGMIYPISKIPTKPHIGCRCWVVENG